MTLAAPPMLLTSITPFKEKTVPFGLPEAVIYISRDDKDIWSVF